MLELRVLGSLDFGGSDQPPLARVLSQPKRAAILVFLTLAEPRGYHRRDELLALFWPKRDERRARNALNQSLTFLRRHLPAGTIRSRGSGEVRVDLASIWCDAVEFDTALRAGRYSAALDLYRGPFLSAFHLTGVDGFIRWVEGRRAALRERATDAAWQLAHAEVRTGALAEAERAAERAISLLPTDEARATDFVEALYRVGARPAAARVYDKFSARLRNELDLEPSPETRRRLEPILAQQIRSLAVLPLQNLSDDQEEEYFADGLTEALIGELAGIEELSVTSGTSAMHYKSTDKLAPEIARELGVDALVDGSVLQAGEEIRLILRLVHAATDRNLWSRSFRRNLRDILTLQGEVARAIADEVQVTVSPTEEARLRRARTIDPAAHRLWLKGNFHLAHLNERSTRRAIAVYREAIERYPGYAPGYAGLAMANVVLSEWHSSVAPEEVVPEAREAAERALELDPTMPQGHIALGRALQTGDWDWEGADRCYRRGIELNPSDAMGRIVYANFLTAMQRFEEAIRLGRGTVERDPLTPQAWNELGHTLHFAGRDEEALRHYGEALEIDHDPRLTHLLLAFLHEGAGRTEVAAAHLNGAVDPGSDLGSYVPNWVGFYGYLAGRVGRRSEALDALSHLEERREREYVPATAVASAHWGLGDQEQTVGWLQCAFRERDPYLLWLRASPWFAPLQADGRVREILSEMGLTA